MAEFVFQDMIRKQGLTDCFQVESAATSREEIGNPVHPGTRRKLKQEGIPMWDHRAVQMTKKDYEEYDYIIAMERYNVRNIERITGRDTEGKIHLLLEYTERPGDIADPWYTGNFDETYRDIVEGCKALLDHLLSAK
jgi:protein-tyrosine phosphatase